MNRINSINVLRNLDLKLYKHASNIIAKNNKWNEMTQIKKRAFTSILEQYMVFHNANVRLVGHTDEIITQRTELLNTYYDFLNNNGFYNIFRSQGKFRPTILEEFMYLLFKDYIAEVKNNNSNFNNLRIGSAKAYTNLFFSGLNCENFSLNPEIGINEKDQDFAIYRPINIRIGDLERNANLPIIAIENKTYIDKTMLEGAIATAEKMKLGNPYSMFFIVAEDYDVSLTIDPVYSKVDQIYILRKRKKNQPVRPIYADVLIDLVGKVKNHLSRNWSDVENKMTNEGKII